MKDRMNSEINNQLDRYSSLKMKYDDLVLESRHTDDKLRERKTLNEGLSNRLRNTTDELHNEVERIKDENNRKRETIDQYLRDNKDLDESCKQVGNENRNTENDLSALRKKHEYSMNDFANIIRRLEQDNYNLLKAKEDLERRMQEKNNEQRNLNFDLKYQKEEGIKRETNHNDSLNKNETELLREKEN